MDSGKSTDPLIGSIFGTKYRVLEKLGSGGMGGVYRAEHLLMKRHVALKLLRPNLLEDEVLQKRFHNEAKAASQISHPNAVTLFDFGIEGNVPYLVMELIQGRTLKQLLEDEKSISVERVALFLRQISEALNHAHRLGIIHRDIKPDNFMVRVEEDGREVVKVLDFGIAKSIGPSQLTPEANLTQVGMLIGTPQYMSPEQCQGKEVDARSDIYSLGIVVFELLAGEAPLKANSVLELLVKVLNSPVESLRKLKPELGISEALDKVILKSLEKEPNLRFANVLEFAAGFERAVAGNKTVEIAKAPSSTWKIALGGLLVTAVMGALFIQRSVPGNSGLDGLDSTSTDILEAARQVEEEQRLALEKAEEEKNRLLAEQEEAAARAEKAQQLAMEQVAEAKAEAARLAESAKQMEAEKEELLRRMAETASAAKDLQAKVSAEAAQKEQADLRERAELAEKQRGESKRLEETIKRANDERVEALARADRLKQQAEANQSKATEAADRARKLRAERNRQQLEIRSSVTAETAKAVEAAKQPVVPTVQTESSENKNNESKSTESKNTERKNTESNNSESKNPEPPADAEQPSQPATKQRRRCGPNWCM